MKKLILSLIILGGVLRSNAQTQEESDYNPYRYEEWKTSNEQAYAQEHQEFLAKECDALELQAFIEKYNVSKDIQFLYVIGEYNCSKIIDFAIDLIKTSPDKEARKMAIVMLGYRRYYDASQLLLNYVKNDISSDEKITIAKTLISLNRKIEALEILDCNCYNMNEMDDNCIWTYFDSFDKSTAIKYFEYYFNKPETQLEAACWLARLGVYNKTFPLFIEYLKNSTAYSRGTEYALGGLAAIGTEEALDIIEQYAKNDTSLIGRTATIILDNIMRGRRIK
jgi:hypothetical protein